MKLLYLRHVDRAYDEYGRFLPRALMLLNGPRPLRLGIAYTRLIVFLCAFAGLVIFVAYYYLFPAMEAAKKATPPQRRLLSAHARLVLALLLFILLCGLILTFRVGRFFLPRRQQRDKPTIYSDAWVESARRLEVDRDKPQK